MKIEELCAAIIHGEQSGPPDPFDINAFIASKRKPASTKAGFPPSRE